MGRAMTLAWVVWALVLFGPLFAGAILRVRRMREWPEWLQVVGSLMAVIGFMCYPAKTVLPFGQVPGSSFRFSILDAVLDAGMLLFAAGYFAQHVQSRQGASGNRGPGKNKPPTIAGTTRVR